MNAAEPIRIDQSRMPAAAFPRPLDWWQHVVPCWLTASIDPQGRVVLEPNGYRADGVQRDVTPVLRRRHLKAAREWAENHAHLADALEAGEDR